MICVLMPVHFDSILANIFKIALAKSVYFAEIKTVLIINKIILVFKPDILTFLNQDRLYAFKIKQHLYSMLL